MIYKRLPPHDMPYKHRSFGKHSKMVKLENKYKRMCSEIGNLMAHTLFFSMVLVLMMSNRVLFGQSYMSGH